MEYTKRTKYFKYLNIDVHNTSDEDIKKHFRISNRFIREVEYFNKLLYRHYYKKGKCLFIAEMDLILVHALS